MSPIPLETRPYELFATTASSLPDNPNSAKTVPWHDRGTVGSLATRGSFTARGDTPARALDAPASCFAGGMPFGSLPGPLPGSYAEPR